MENRLRVRISRMFQSSFGSCKPRNTSDVIENASFDSRHHHHPHPEAHRTFHLTEHYCDPLLSPQELPRPPPLPSICKPRCPLISSALPINTTCIVSSKSINPRKKISGNTTAQDGRFCPPSSPILPLNTFLDFKDHCYYYGFTEDKKMKYPGQKTMHQKKTNKLKNKKKKKKKKKKSKSSMSMGPLSSSSQSTYFDDDWFSSDDEREDETETLFSSRSLSSDSSECRWGHRRLRRNEETFRRRRAEKTDVGVMPMSERDNMKGSFAVVKRSSDPYSDFRTSMVEMIVERQIFAARDLEELLQCFLSLNSRHHHRIIVEVFTEIYEALFCNWC